MTKLYTPQQVAKILQISVPTVKRWLLSGELPGIKIGPGGYWRIRSDDLVKYANDRYSRKSQKLSKEDIADE